MNDVRAYVGPVAMSPGRWCASLQISGLAAEEFEGRVSQAISWARERTGWVLVLDKEMYWAGTDPRPDDVPLRWPE